MVPTEDDDDDAASDIEERLELDYQLGEDIKEKLIPRAVDWFTGEALQFEEMDDGLEEGEFDDEDDEDEDDMSDDRDDDEESDDDVSSYGQLTYWDKQLTIDRTTTPASQSRRPLSASSRKSASLLITEQPQSPSYRLTKEVLWPAERLHHPTSH